jgi:beta-galactosidase
VSAAGSVTAPVSLNGGWQFTAGPGSTSGPPVTAVLPHCVTDLSWRNWDVATWERTWIYRRTFDLPVASLHSRIFLDFDGALTIATPSVNGVDLPVHKGGYLPFTYEVTEHVVDQKNALTVNLDSRWVNVPPEGSPTGPDSIDYLEPGGLSRDASLRVVPSVFVSDVFAAPVSVTDSNRRVEVRATVDPGSARSGVPPATGRYLLSATLVERQGARPTDRGGNVLARSSVRLDVEGPGEQEAHLVLERLGPVRLWDVADPVLYTLDVTLEKDGRALHTESRRIGLRDARFELDGFYLNDRRLQLFGLNRHQIYPFAGMSMPARVQRRDVKILKYELNCNMVRCSHYPQSPHFLDACDELGVLVWEETPGWHYLGDQTFAEQVVQNVTDMVRRDRSRPSVVIWGVQVNESTPDPVLYTQTKAVAKELDGTRPTSGAMDIYSTATWVQDVFAYDDYAHSATNALLLPPLAGVPYLVTEAVGALDGAPYYRRTDPQAIQQEQARLHAEVHDIAASTTRYSGLLGWCGFDYDSLNGFIFENVKWPGVADTFRVLKPGAAFYQSQVDPATRVVIAPAFYWDFSQYSPVTSLGSTAMVCSNCERLEVYVGGDHYATLHPERAGYPHLAYPPFLLDVTSVDSSSLPELRIDGYVKQRVAASVKFAADTAGDHLSVSVDDTEIAADGSDATRVAFRAVDRYGAPRPYVTGDVELVLRGPGRLVGETPFAFGTNGGVGAVWIRSLPGRRGTVRLTASHGTLGSGTVEIRTA